VTCLNHLVAAEQHDPFEGTAAEAAGVGHLGERLRLGLAALAYAFLVLVELYGEEDASTDAVDVPLVGVEFPVVPAVSSSCRLRLLSSM
jgi:hypothetical protein